MSTGTAVRPSKVAYAVALIGLLVVVDTTIMVIATGRLAEEFSVGLPVIQGVTTAYTLALVAVIPLSAWFVARLGAYTTYLGAIAVFTIGSLLAACAWDLGSLIAFRGLQGLGGGLLMPVGMTIALQATPHEARGGTMAVLGLPVLVGPVLGPTLGGWLVDVASWRAFFLVNVPIGVIGLITAARVLPHDRPAGGRRLDVLGLLTLSPGIAALVLGLSKAGEQGRFLAPTAAGPVLAGLGLIALHLVRSRTAADPLVRFTLLRTRSVAVGSGTLAFFAAAYFGTMLILPLNLLVVRGEQATVAGLLGIPQAVATGVSLQIASRLADRVGSRPVVLFGIVTAAMGYASYGLVTRADTPYVQLVACMVVAGAGVGATLMPTMTAAVRNLDGDDLASGNTLLQIVSQTMVSVGTAVSSVVFAFAFSRHVTSVDGLDAAYALDAGTRDALAPAMAEAFRQTMLLPVGLMLCALVVSWLGLPRRSPSHATDT